MTEAKNPQIAEEPTNVLATIPDVIIPELEISGPEPPPEDAGLDEWTEFTRNYIRAAEWHGKRATIYASRAGLGLFHIRAIFMRRKVRSGHWA